ncbi:MAG: hypothetical protein R8K46_01415 [Mariprofundaceae bacterium]
MSLIISRGAAQVMLQHALKNQPKPVCGILAGGEDHIDHAQALVCTEFPSRGYVLNALALRQILTNWERRGLACMGVYFAGESLLNVSELTALTGISVDRLWQVKIDMDTKGRLDLHASLGVGMAGAEAPMEMCEDGEMQTLYPVRACD